MILFPPAKLNLGLQITAKRSDGFHDLQTIFYQFPLTDVLEVLKDDSIAPGTCTFFSSGIPIPSGENLCEKAYHLLNSAYSLPGVKILLHKIIPIGAGLGGGSSNAVYTLKLLNTLFNLKLDSNELKAFALELGSDCPLFIHELPVYAEGRGELLNEINISLKGYYLIVVNPGIHIATAEAFSKCKPRLQESCLDIVQDDIRFWKKRLHNDFEDSIFPSYPQISDIKSTLYELGALYASMSGSGATVFGLFKNPIPNTHFPKDYFVWQCKL